MQTRNKYIISIIVAWIVLILLILAVSASMSISSFIQLEKKITVDSVNRVSRVMLANLERLFTINSDYAYWDDTYHYVNNKDNKYIETNLADDFFKSNQLNDVLILDASSKVI